MTDTPKTHDESQADQKPKTRESEDPAQERSLEEKMDDASEMLKEDDETLQHLAKRIDEDELKT